MSHCGPVLALITTGLLLAGCSGPAAPAAPPPKGGAAPVAAARPNTVRDFAAGRWIDLVADGVRSDLFERLQQARLGGGRTDP